MIQMMSSLPPAQRAQFAQSLGNEILMVYDLGYSRNSFHNVE